MRINRKPPRRETLRQYESSKKRGMIMYYAMKGSNDPRAVAARKHMEHKAYGGIV